MLQNSKLNVAECRYYTVIKALKLKERLKSLEHNHILLRNMLLKLEKIKERKEKNESEDQRIQNKKLK